MRFNTDANSSKDVVITFISTDESHNVNESYRTKIIKHYPHVMTLIVSRKQYKQKQPAMMSTSPTKRSTTLSIAGLLYHRIPNKNAMIKSNVLLLIKIG